MVGLAARTRPALGDTVLSRLAQGWSPQQVAGRLARDAGYHIIGYESIYRFIHAQIRRTNTSTWSRYLPRGKARRGWHRKPKGPASFIQQRIPVSQRPTSANDRQIPGHWEADFMLFATYGHAVLVAHERRSRVTLIARLPNRKAEATAHAIADLLAPLPAQLRRSITFDNGTEFARHYLLHKAMNVDTFFCDPHSPWQKGGVENAIGRIRRFLPRKTNLDTLDPEQFCALTLNYNNTPRKCLDFKTPLEVISHHLLHFECESTS